MKYKSLTDEHKDEIIADFHLAQERDHHCHSLNVARYERMVRTLPEGKFKERITELLKSEQEALSQVTAIIESTSEQLPEETRLQAAHARNLERQQKA